MIMQPVTAQRRLARLQTYKVDSMPGPRRIEGFAIVSEDGMLANAEGIMPDSLKFEAPLRGPTAKSAHPLAHSFIGRGWLRDYL